MSEPAPSPAAPARPAAAVFIIGTVLIDAMGFGLIMPVLPSLLMDLTQADVGVAASWGGLATFVYAVMQFLFSPVIGGLSDRFGRRPVLLMSLTALAADFILMGLAHALWVFFIARTLSGIFAATHSTANAYIADTTPKELRATRFGWIGAAFGVGFILGPALGGLLGELSPRAPFFAAAALAALNAAYGFFVVPESLPKEKRRAFSWERANPIGTLMQLRRTEGLGVLVAVYFVSSLSTFVYPAVWSYVAIAKSGWSEAEIGASIAFYGLVFAISQAAMFPLVLPRLGERRAIWIALGVEAVSLIGVATAPSGVYVYAWITTALISGMQGPALQKVMTQRVGEDAQGELQGGLSALSSIVLIISPLFYTQLFFAFENGVAGLVFPGAPFIAASAMSWLALALFLARRRRRTGAAPDHPA
ncbi:MAG: MFS transporter [Caulobacterales bacterium]|nr:MFS transporter [Caulobacterales bacterium]